MHFEYRKCCVCKSENSKAQAKVPYRIPENMHRYQHSLHLCNDCNFFFINPTLSKEDLDNYYNTSTSYHLFDNYDTLLDSYKKKAEQQFAFIKKHFRDDNLAILDYGCATGYSLQPFISSSNRLFGYDPAKELADIATQKYSITCYSDESLICGHMYDLICLSHVLEHLIEPEEVLIKLSDVLRENGRIYIEVPDIDYAPRCLQNQTQSMQELYSYISFEHLNYFNKSSLTNLLSRIGFHPVSVENALNNNGTTPHYPVIQSLWVKVEPTTKELMFSDPRPLQEYLEQERAKVDVFREKIRSLIDGKKILVYGAGMHTSRIFTLFEDLQRYIVGFTDSDQRKWQTLFLGDKPCKKLTDYDFESYDAILISSASSEKEIYNNLRKTYPSLDKPLLRLYTEDE